MPRPKPDEPTQQVALRLPLSLIARADQLAAQMAADTPGLKITRTDAMRIVLSKHLPPLRESAAQPAPSAKPSTKLAKRTTKRKP